MDAVAPAFPEAPGRRELNRVRTRQAIADAAARLVAERGIDATTADDIAAAAGIGRATFFRHFESKELAIATGLSGAALFVLVGILDEVPADVGAMDAVRRASARLGEDYDAQRAMFLEQARLSWSSPSMFAWTLHLYVEWEAAIAAAVAPRFADLRPGDPRPRLVGALVMAAWRLAVDTWVAGDGADHLPRLIQAHLAAVALTDPT
ncbi:TetR family transcriptional regulator [Nocardioides stalactiti]|uniref:TetR family transcriptional regulator n=1 Tax=Nocardioides stalactiti TaxID=2755356 RepID=UPI0015FF17FF|nr:TetR family transcriptional regulator [Nocardioides stalactiti]